MTVAKTIALPQRESLQKTWIRYAAVSGGLIACCLILLFLSWPEPYFEYVESTLLPRYEKAFGFRGGRLATSKDSSIYALVVIEPGGKLADAGARSGDIPYLNGSTGVGPFYDALKSASAGKEGEFWVISDRNDYEGKGARRIVLKSEAQ